MKILKIWDADYPWDIRVEKVCISLNDQGHEVHLLCRNLKGRPTFEKEKFGFVHRLPCFRNRRLNYLLSFPAFFNPIWIFYIFKLVKNNKIDLIMVRDLPMALAGIVVGKFTRNPVVLDMAENYPFLIDDIWEYEPFKKINIIVRNRSLTRIVEKIVLETVDHVITVVEESQERVLQQCLRLENRVSIVSNTPELNMIRSSSVLPQQDREIFYGKYVLIYVGGLRLGRGIDQIFEVIPTVVSKVPNFLFLIIGTGSIVEKLKDDVKILGISEYVYFKGWVDFDKVFSYIAAADVGVIPHYVTNHTNHTVPNKLFDYMGLGLPVVASSAKPIRRIIETEKCGLIFNNELDLASSLIELSDAAKRKMLGDNGRKAVRSTYNWQKSIENFSSTLKTVREQKTKQYSK